MINDNHKKSNEYFLQQIIDSIPNPILYKNLNFTMVACNSAFESFYGLDKSEIINRNNENLFGEKTGKKITMKERILLFSHKPISYEDVLTLPNGTKKNVLITKSIYDFKNEHGIVTTIHDISRMKKIEQLLEDALKQKDIISKISSCFVEKVNINEAIDITLSYMGKTITADNAYIVNFTKDKKSMILTNAWNKNNEKKVMHPLDNILCSDIPWFMNKLNNGYWIHIKDIDDLQDLSDYEKEILEQNKIKSLLLIPLSFNNRIFGFIGFDSIHSISSWNSTSLNFLKTCSEIFENAYERKNIDEKLKNKNKELQIAIENLQSMQSKLIQQEKLAGIGHLAAGVAHEINNPLGYLFSNMDTLQSYCNKFNILIAKYKELKNLCSYQDNSEIQNKLEDINTFEEDNYIDFALEDLEGLFHDSQDGLNRVSEIVKSLKLFSHIDHSPAFQDYNLNEGINNTLIVSKNEIKYIANVETILEDIPLIPALGGQINQVLLNIILNACHAIKSAELNDLGLIKIHTYRKDLWIYCEIEDNGIGISKEIINKIFNPFFTTKPIGKGTGLGLSLAYDIITNKHNGELTVFSTVKMGTKFIIKLPVSQ